MGEVCCRRAHLGPETELYPSQPYDNYVLEPHKHALDPILLEKLTMKYSANIKSIIKIQAWYRGCISRKKYKAGPLTCRTIINYISTTLKSNEVAVENIEKQLGPFDVSWDLENVKKEGLELRKATVESNNTLYHGYWNVHTGKKEGYGQKLFPNGTKYEGYWDNDEFDGRGRFIYENGDYFVGEWKNGMTDGIGTFVSTEGIRYEGGWKNNQHQGFGIEVWEDGSRFEGSYVAGQKEGKGKFFWTDGSVYEGGFRDNKLDGYGVYRWTDGRVYDGQWKNSKMEGRGKFVFPDGKVYVGEMRNDMRHGNGKMVW
eukprot:TRINITY_DN14771_c0_g1_i4.p1 TRINITY_DN14771_c0_g1~~TRINITY_DN14771_c0_g1_i4.p1  ORF type:complete len:314 (-),score=95.47 TRINITY_DN14771_c0_g1_i4:308-1249(-)